MDLTDVIEKHTLRINHHNIGLVLKLLPDGDIRRQQIIEFMSIDLYVSQSTFIGPFLSRYNAHFSK